MLGISYVMLLPVYPTIIAASLSIASAIVVGAGATQFPLLPGVYAEKLGLFKINALELSTVSFQSACVSVVRYPSLVQGVPVIYPNPVT